MDRKKQLKISLGILVSYDYEYLKISLPAIYPYVDYILLAIDKNQKTWKGYPFHISDDFFDWIQDFDKEDKIKLYHYEIDYSAPPMETETLLRNQMGDMMPPSDWYMQIDTDEYIINGHQMLEELQKIDMLADKQTMLYAKSIPMFKSDENNQYIIDVLEHYPMFTNIPKYDHARISHTAIKKNIDVYFLHQSWDRNENEILMKIQNWGHSSDFDVMSYFKFWESINVFNFRYIKDFHPVGPSKWHSLVAFPISDSLIKSKSLADFIQEKKRKKERIEQESKLLKNRIISFFKKYLN